MRSRRLLIAAMAGLLLAPALAIPGGWVDVDDDDSEVGIGAIDDGVIKGSSGGGGSTRRCTWSEVPPPQLDNVWWENAPENAGRIPNPSEYDWYWKSCPLDDGSLSTDLIPVRRGGPVVDPTVLRDMAVDRLKLPGPAVGMNPPGDQVVQLESWLWIDDAIWQKQSRSVSAGGVTATVTATPRRVIWEMGNGDTVTCAGPGTPYDPSRPSAQQTTDCAYTYRHSSAGRPRNAYRVIANVEWGVSWSVVGAAGGGSLPPLFTSSPLWVGVAELQALNQ